MDLLGDPLTTRPFQTGWELTMELYPSGQCGFIDDPDCRFGNGSVWTRTWTRSDAPEPLLTLHGTMIWWHNSQPATYFCMSDCIPGQLISFDRCFAVFRAPKWLGSALSSNRCVTLLLRAVATCILLTLVTTSSSDLHLFSSVIEIPNKVGCMWVGKWSISWAALICGCRSWSGSVMVVGRQVAWRYAVYIWQPSSLAGLLHTWSPSVVLSVSSSIVKWN